MTGAMEKVNLARAKGRPTATDYIENVFCKFLQMQGDRRFSDDKAVIAGIGWLKDMPVTIVGIDKGKELKDKAAKNFGSANPEGYRKALRQFRLAEKFCRPIVCLIDTSGAYCGIGAEERGQGQAIAENIMEMLNLSVPVISVIIGEGGSGGALALAAADQVWMLENAVYSVISPEGCASILWKDSSKAALAAESLKMTAQDLFEGMVCESIIPENRPWEEVYGDLKERLYAYFTEAKKLTAKEIAERRYNKFRNIGR